MTHFADDALFTRRRALTGALGLGISVEFLASRAWSASESAAARKRLVVIICRGGLDGLSLSPPVGDMNYAALRGPIALSPPGQPGGVLRLDGTFGLHPAMPVTYALAMKGEARIAPAVATPDRERSHFEAQDVLESGAAVAYGTTSGWLNRALLAMGPASKVTALSLGATAPLILRGKFEAASWSPGVEVEHDPRLPNVLQDIYASDPVLARTFAAGLATRAMASLARADAPGMASPSTENGSAKRGRVDDAKGLGASLAGFMAQQEGPQVAAVVIDGFDTHAGQGAAQGHLALRLAYVDAFVDGLSMGLGPAWRDTVVVMATEFGRTARVNGTGGTDHGTASTALLLGGALKKGGIVGDWPTLAAARLFEGRDTAPTADMRALFKGILIEHMGVERTAVDTVVFPNSAAISPITRLV